MNRFILTQPQTESISQRGIFRVEICNLWNTARICPRNSTFCMYINDLPDAMEFASELYLYADDTKIFKEIYKTSDCEDIQKDMHLMHAWSEKWMLKFHPDKCKTMRIGRSKVENMNILLRLI